MLKNDIPNRSYINLTFQEDNRDFYKDFVLPDNHGTLESRIAGLRNIGSYAGNIELQAIVHLFRRPIHIFEDDAKDPPTTGILNKTK